MLKLQPPTLPAKNAFSSYLLLLSLRLAVSKSHAAVIVYTNFNGLQGQDLQSLPNKTLSKALNIYQWWIQYFLHWGGGANLFLVNFFQKLHENEKNWTRGVPCAPFYPSMNVIL